DLGIDAADQAPTKIFRVWKGGVLAAKGTLRATQFEVSEVKNGVAEPEGRFRAVHRHGAIAAGAEFESPFGGEVGPNIGGPIQPVSGGRDGEAALGVNFGRGLPLVIGEPIAH